MYIYECFEKVKKIGKTIWKTKNWETLEKQLPSEKIEKHATHMKSWRNNNTNTYLDFKWLDHEFTPTNDSQLHLIKMHKKVQIEKEIRAKIMKR